VIKPDAFSSGKSFHESIVALGAIVIGLIEEGNYTEVREEEEEKRVCGLMW
jgi:hypothetical protein